MGRAGPGRAAAHEAAHVFHGLNLAAAHVTWCVVKCECKTATNRHII